MPLAARVPLENELTAGLDVLVQGSGKGVGTRLGIDQAEIQIIRVRRGKGSLEGNEAGTADRSGNQPRPQIRVIVAGNGQVGIQQSVRMRLALYFGDDSYNFV